MRRETVVLLLMGETSQRGLHATADKRSWESVHSQLWSRQDYKDVDGDGALGKADVPASKRRGM